MSNVIVTKADIHKLRKLVDVGIESGKAVELSINSCTSLRDDSLYLFFVTYNFLVSKETLHEVFADELHTSVTAPLEETQEVEASDETQEVEAQEVEAQDEASQDETSDDEEDEDEDEDEEDDEPF